MSEPTKVLITPIPKKYEFIVNAYRVTFYVVPKDDAGSHPLDILQVDLTEVVNALKQLERFRVDEPLKALPSAEGKYTLEDLGITKNPEWN